MDFLLWLPNVMTLWLARETGSGNKQATTQCACAKDMFAPPILLPSNITKQAVKCLESRLQSDIMAALGFDGGDVDLEQLGLPVANAENKLLEAEVQRKENEINSLQLQIDEYKDRVQAVSDHLRNVRQELQQTQVRDADAVMGEFLTQQGLFHGVPPKLYGDSPL